MSVIFHLDLDCFFVAVERLRDPSLIGKPVAVGGKGPRSVISSASYEARKFGVHSAMPTSVALRKCPELILCSGGYGEYSAYSKRVFSVVRTFAPTFEQVSVDEGYLDMTGSQSLFGPPLEAGRKLKARILAETGLTCSIGIAGNRLVAKVATDFCKPDNVYEVPEGHEAPFLAPMAARVLPGIGPSTEKWLRGRGIFTVAELQAFPAEVLERHLGQFGSYLHDIAWGRGSTEFFEEAKSRSISRERTYEKDVADPDILKATLREMAEEMGRELRSENAFARVIRIKLRYPPFVTLTRSRALKAPVQRDSALFDELEKLLEANWNPGDPIRLIGAGCVLGDGTRQFSLFEDAKLETRREKLDALKDAIRDRFGPEKVK